MSEPPTRTLRIENADEFHAEVAKAVREARLPVMLVISGKNVGQSVRLVSTITIGRDPHMTLSLSDPIASFRHAIVEDRGDSWVLLDTGSTNGTFVNGERLTGEHRLVNGDRITVGSTVLRFELHDLVEQAFDETLERMINVDELTGLWVRRKFDLEFAKALDSAKASNTPLSLLVMDLDGVKRINDTHGHLFGEYVIGAAGKLMLDHLKGRSFGSRFGGDEYVAALPGANFDAGVAFGEELLEAINAYPFEFEGIALRAGISIGVSAYPDSGATPDALFQAGDEAMYRAKQAGKNRVSR